MSNNTKTDTNNQHKVWFKNLQKARENKGYTQVKLAIEAEVSQQSITFYETGTRVPSLEVAVKLAKILDTTVDYLLGNDDDMIQSYYELSQRDKDTVSNVVEGLKEKNNN